MVFRLNHYTGLIGLLSIAFNTPSQAENSVKVGLVASVNSSFYKDVGEEYYVLPLVLAEYGRFYLQGIHGDYRLFEDHG
jgi:outer membrane scaffolding protein for murein synthesis (MipA/OmpV family)